MTHRHNTTCIMKNQKLPSTNAKLCPMPHHDITIQHFGPSVFICRKVQRDLADMNWLPYVACQVTDVWQGHSVSSTVQVSCEHAIKTVSRISSSWLAISELRGVIKVWCQRSLLAARHKRAHLALTPASKAGTRFTYMGGMEG